MKAILKRDHVILWSVSHVMQTMGDIHNCEAIQVFRVAHGLCT